MATGSDEMHAGAQPRPEGFSALALDAAAKVEAKTSPYTPAWGSAEASGGLSVSVAQAQARFDARRRQARRKDLLCGAVLLALVLFSLCQGVSDQGLLYSPSDVAGSLVGWFRLNVVAFFVPSVSLEQTQILAEYPMYHEVMTRVSYTLVTVVCGAMLAVSGMLYQNAFKNPVAGPGLLGVSTGVSVGLVLLVYLYGSSATYMFGTRYLFSYLGGLAILVVVFVVGRLAGGKRSTGLIDMLLVASIIASLLGTVTSYIVNYLFDDTLWLAYFNITNATDLDGTGFSLAVLAVATVVSFVPLLFTRFGMNCLAFGDDDMRLLGIRPAPLRFIALACGSVMILTAQTFCGAVSMSSLVVPFIVRGVYGTEFSRQFVGNVLIGAIVLLICRSLVSLIPFAGTGIPLGTMVTVVMLPGFVWVMTAAQKQWAGK